MQRKEPAKGDLLCFCSVPRLAAPRGAEGPSLKKSTARLEDKYINVCQATREQSKKAVTMMMITSES